MPSYDELQAKKRTLIRKTLDGSLLLAPPSAPVIDTIQGNDGMLEIPEDYKDVGWCNDDGHQFERDVETATVTGYGSTSPLRVDINQQTTTLQAVMIETNRRTLEVYNSLQLDSLSPNSDGSLVIDESPRPKPRYYRGLSLNVDMTDDGELYIARYLPYMSPSDFGGQAMQSGDDPLTYDVTFTGYVDETAHTAHRWLFGGPGWIALLERMGFPALNGGGLPAGGDGGGEE